MMNKNRSSIYLMTNQFVQKTQLLRDENYSSSVVGNCWGKELEVKLTEEKESSNDWNNNGYFLMNLSKHLHEMKIIDKLIYWYCWNGNESRRESVKRLEEYLIDFIVIDLWNHILNGHSDENTVKFYLLSRIHFSYNFPSILLMNYLNFHLSWSNDGEMSLKMFFKEFQEYLHEIKLNEILTNYKSCGNSRNVLMEGMSKEFLIKSIFTNIVQLMKENDVSFKKHAYLLKMLLNMFHFIHSIVLVEIYKNIYEVSLKVNGVKSTEFSHLYRQLVIGVQTLNQITQIFIRELKNRSSKIRCYSINLLNNIYLYGMGATTEFLRSYLKFDLVLNSENCEKFIRFRKRTLKEKIELNKEFEELVEIMKENSIRKPLMVEMKKIEKRFINSHYQTQTDMENDEKLINEFGDMNENILREMRIFYRSTPVLPEKQLKSEISFLHQLTFVRQKKFLVEFLKSIQLFFHLLIDRKQDNRSLFLQLRYHLSIIPLDVLLNIENFNCIYNQLLSRNESIRCIFNEFNNDININIDSINLLTNLTLFISYEDLSVEFYVNERANRHLIEPLANSYFYRQYEYLVVDENDRSSTIILKSLQIILNLFEKLTNFSRDIEMESKKEDDHSLNFCEIVKDKSDNYSTELEHVIKSIHLNERREKLLKNRQLRNEEEMSMENIQKFNSLDVTLSSAIETLTINIGRYSPDTVLEFGKYFVKMNRNRFERLLNYRINNLLELKENGKVEGNSLKLSTFEYETVNEMRKELMRKKIYHLFDVRRKMKEKKRISKRIQINHSIHQRFLKLTRKYKRKRENSRHLSKVIEREENVDEDDKDKNDNGDEDEDKNKNDDGDGDGKKKRKKKKKKKVIRKKRLIVTRNMIELRRQKRKLFEIGQKIAIENEIKSIQSLINLNQCNLIENDDGMMIGGRTMNEILLQFDKIKKFGNRSTTTTYIYKRSVFEDVFSCLCELVSHKHADVRENSLKLLRYFSCINVHYLCQTLNKTLLNARSFQRNVPSNQRFSSGQKWNADSVEELNVKEEEIENRNMNNEKNASMEYDVRSFRNNKSQSIPIVRQEGTGAFIHGVEDEFDIVRITAVESLAILAMECPILTSAQLGNHEMASAQDLLIDLLNDELHRVREHSLVVLNEIAEEMKKLRDNYREHFEEDDNRLTSSYYHQRQYLLDHEQLIDLTASLDDASNIVRYLIRQILMKLFIQSHSTLLFVIERMFKNIKRFASAIKANDDVENADATHIYYCLAALGRHHPSHIPNIIGNLFDIPLYVDSKGILIGMDQLMNGKFIMIFNAIAYDEQFLQYNIERKYIQLLPQYTSNFYRYLRLQYGNTFVPEIKYFENLSIANMANSSSNMWIIEKEITIIEISFKNMLNRTDLIWKKYFNSISIMDDKSIDWKVNSDYRSLMSDCRSIGNENERYLFKQFLRLNRLLFNCNLINKSTNNNEKMCDIYDLLQMDFLNGQHIEWSELMNKSLMKEDNFHQLSSSHLSQIRRLLLLIRYNLMKYRCIDLYSSALVDMIEFHMKYYRNSNVDDVLKNLLFVDHFSLIQTLSKSLEKLRSFRYNYHQMRSMFIWCEHEDNYFLDKKYFQSFLLTFTIEIPLILLTSLMENVVMEEECYADMEMEDAILKTKNKGLILILSQMLQLLINLLRLFEQFIRCLTYQYPKKSMKYYQNLLHVINSELRNIFQQQHHNYQQQQLFMLIHFLFHLSEIVILSSLVVSYEEKDDLFNGNLMEIEETNMENEKKSFDEIDVENMNEHIEEEHVTSSLILPSSIRSVKILKITKSRLTIVHDDQLDTNDKDEKDDKMESNITTTDNTNPTNNLSMNNNLPNKMINGIVGNQDDDGGDYENDMENDGLRQLELEDLSDIYLKSESEQEDEKLLEINLTYGLITHIRVIHDINLNMNSILFQQSSTVGIQLLEYFVSSFAIRLISNSIEEYHHVNLNQLISMRIRNPTDLPTKSYLKTFNSNLRLKDPSNIRGDLFKLISQFIREHTSDMVDIILTFRTMIPIYCSIETDVQTRLDICHVFDTLRRFYDKSVQLMDENEKGVRLSDRLEIVEDWKRMKLTETGEHLNLKEIEEFNNYQKIFVLKDDDLRRFVCQQLNDLTNLMNSKESNLMESIGSEGVKRTTNHQHQWNIFPDSERRIVSNCRYKDVMSRCTLLSTKEQIDHTSTSLVIDTRNELAEMDKLTHK
ncbi:hypothetical protein SNEBB_007522 [Seison nebaliae]|nr:hypothetical protein SNEBB_007522 [Seison nebaliae]